MFVVRGQERRKGIVGGNKQGQRRKQKQIPCGDDKQKGNGKAEGRSEGKNKRLRVGSRFLISLFLISTFILANRG